MKVPECKLCGKAHWSSEEHADIEPNVPGYVREMARGALGGDAVQIKRTGPINGRNKRDNKRTEEPSANHQTVSEKPLDDGGSDRPSSGLLRPEAAGEGAGTRKVGRPKKWASEAERKRAYRGRK